MSETNVEQLDLLAQPRRKKNPAERAAEAASKPPVPLLIDEAALKAHLAAFNEFGKETKVLRRDYALNGGGTVGVDVFVNEFWTAGQREGHPLHEFAYRACFKPQVPRFFIERLTQAGERVYDPFMGRGTTLLEAALLDRVPVGNDINPISQYLIRARLNPPGLHLIEERLRQIDWATPAEAPEDLLVFYHPETLQEIAALRRHLIAAMARGPLDPVDDWIALIALNRLTGHSAGFFSVYTLPPNQAVSVGSQKRINEKRNQTPPRRHVPALILRRTKRIYKHLKVGEFAHLRKHHAQIVLLAELADQTAQIKSDSISLVVTSPPFLNVVNYALDNWLRCWFLGIDAKAIQISWSSSLDSWRATMSGVFRELLRVVRPGGFVAFEVGEVQGGKTLLEDHAIPVAVESGFKPVLLLINDQKFTKTANCWGVDNSAKGTNTNRVIVLRK